MFARTWGKVTCPTCQSARGSARALDEIPLSEFKAARPTTTRRRLDPSDRKVVVPRGCPIKVTDNRISEIFRELRTLELDAAPNSIAIFLRVFLEMSVDHFLEANKIPLDETLPNGRKRFKGLDKKLAETVQLLVAVGVPAAHFNSVTRGVSNVNSPMHMDLFHSYVHDRFATPFPQDLKAAWDQTQPLFEKIWA